MSAMAHLPVPVEGPAAAPLRARLGQPRVRFVDEALSPAIADLCTAFLRDEAATIRKALRRILRSWADSDPAGVAAWADTVKGGLPKLLQPEVRRARKRATKANL
jgi:hypothetical protein